MDSLLDSQTDSAITWTLPCKAAGERIIDWSIWGVLWTKLWMGMLVC